MAEAVCATCLNLRLPLNEHGDTVLHRVIIRDFLRSADTCRFCALIRNIVTAIDRAFSEKRLLPGFGNEDRRVTSRHLEHVLEIFAAGNDDRASVWLKNGISEQRPLSLNFSYNLKRVPNLMCFLAEKSGNLNVSSNLYSWPEISTDSCSSVCLNLVRKWLENCLTYHDKCQFTHFASLPTRLLRIERNKVHGMFVVNLVEDIQQQERYAALSHCWGREQTIKTTKANLKSFMKCVPWLDLPRTFQHGITVAASLRLNYIWIDSLCIIQDDGLDWENESSKMAGIYENAVLTIAASSSTGDADGFLVPRSEILGEVLEGTVDMQPESPGMPTIPITFRPQLDHYSEFAPDEPLELRAWTFQERLLSRRTLLFSSHELRWECNTTPDCECGLNKQAEDFFSPHPYTFESSLSSGDENSSSIWYEEIVPRYTKGMLTKPEDKLPALSGVANRFARLTGDQYVAGLWKKDLLFGLLWRLVETPPHPMPYRYRAPSFAWSSIDGKVAFTKPGQFSEMSWTSEIISVSCQPAGLDRFGQVAEGRLVIYGPLVLCWLYLEQGIACRISFELSKPDTSQDGYFWVTGDSKLDVAETENSSQLEDEVVSQIASIHRTSNDAASSKGWFPCFCLEIGNRKPTFGFGIMEHGLILGASPQEKEAFERLGVLGSLTTVWGDVNVLKHIFESAPKQRVIIV